MVRNEAMLNWSPPKSGCSAHTHSTEPDTVGNAGGNIRLQPSGDRSSHSIRCPPWVRNVPFQPIFRAGGSQKLRGARSGEHGGWVLTGMFSPERKCCINKRCVARCVIVTQKPQVTCLQYIQVTIKTPCLVTNT
jgi:hypothetical protein